MTNPNDMDETDPTLMGSKTPFKLRENEKDKWRNCS